MFHFPGVDGILELTEATGADPREECLPAGVAVLVCTQRAGLQGWGVACLEGNVQLGTELPVLHVHGTLATLWQTLLTHSHALSTHCSLPNASGDYWTPRSLEGPLNPSPCLIWMSCGVTGILQAGIVEQWVRPIFAVLASHMGAGLSTGCSTSNPIPC